MIDFQALKKQVSIKEVAVSFLGLELKEGEYNLRGACPACGTDNQRALVITPERGLYYCFIAQKGGDLISLVSHVRDISLKQAAMALAEAYMKQERETATDDLQPLAHLDFEHPLVEALGFHAVSKRVGIGYASKGLMRSCVAVPIRDPSGKLLGYIGLKDEVKVPSKWRE